MFSRSRVLASRICGFFARHRLDEDFQRELASHLDMLTEENIRRGLPPDEARRQARLRLGGAAQLRETQHDFRGLPWLETLLQDVRFGLRMLRKNPGFTAVAVITLALGIGANTAVFSVANKLLLAPLPFPHAERIVMLERSYPQRDVPQISIPKFIVWRQQTHVFQAVTAYTFGGAGINLTGGDRPEQVRGTHASAGYFDVFSVPFALGRGFDAEEDRPGGPHVAVISDALWRSRFGGDPEIIGKAISLSGDPYQILGVTGPGFRTDPPTDIWIPLQANPNSTDQSNFLVVAALLRPGITIDKAKAAMKLAAEEFSRKFGKSWMFPGETATAKPIRGEIVAGVRPALLVLLGAVGFVLLLACANVANLLLARATARKREIAIRFTVGAGKGRVMRQVLTESLILALAGGVVGLVLGFAGIRALLAVNPAGRNPADAFGYFPLVGEHGSAVSIDWRVLAFTLGVSLVTGVLFGLLPALTILHTDLAATLKESAGRSSADFRRQKTRAALVVSEVALAVVLLAGAALLIRTFEALRSANLGFDSHNVLTMQMSLTGSRFKRTAAVTEITREAETRVGALPGVRSITLACCFPGTGGPDLPFTIEARAPASGGYNSDAEWRPISPDYFDVFRIPLLRGHTFTDRDDLNSEPVAVINETMAKQFWPNSDPIGVHMTIGHGLGPEFEEPPRRIVGIVGDVIERARGQNNAVDPLIYIPEAQVTNGLTALDNAIGGVGWAVRTNVPPLSISAEIRDGLRVATGGLPVAQVRTMDEVVAGLTAWNSFNATLFAVFAGIALFLAAVGIYGLMSYSVQQRSQEIGVRMALGADPSHVRRMVVRQGMTLALIGLFVGVAGGLALTRVMNSLLYGVKPWDPLAFLSTVILLGVVALLACYVPALRASRVDPMVALRHD